MTTVTRMVTTTIIADNDDDDVKPDIMASFKVCGVLALLIVV